MNRRRFLGASGAALLAAKLPATAQDAAPRPNILFCIADDWSWAHASVYGDRVVQTPVFDRVAREGVLFNHSFCSSPSCTPSRAAILTGQEFFRLESSANLWGTLDKKFDVYPDLLEAAGYHVGLTRKGWGPGDFRPGGRTRNPAGPNYKGFEAFLAAKPDAAPFCFWFGSHDPHRPYQPGGVLTSGKKADDIKVPPFLPDAPAVRGDLLDYYFEIERFDREIGQMLATLQVKGMLDNTIVVITADNGMPFPRAKTNLYDYGARMPLAIRWPKRVAGGRTIDDFVSHTDFAPTFLEAAGIKAPDAVTGRSLLPLLTSTQNGQIETMRNAAIFGRERHGTSFPCRALRTKDFLYIRNYKPDKANLDTDNGPAKTFVMEHKDDAQFARFFQLSFGPRPAEELYDLQRDSAQLVNVATQPDYTALKNQFSERLTAILKAKNDPREWGNGAYFDTAPVYRKAK